MSNSNSNQWGVYYVTHGVQGGVVNNHENRNVPEVDPNAPPFNVTNGCTSSEAFWWVAQNLIP
jgi:hypothetical protein